eukprot:4060249-Alexandrium_andersonii.AAC.1
MERLRASFPKATLKFAADVRTSAAQQLAEDGLEETFVQRRNRYAQEANTALQGDEFWRNLFLAHTVRR